MATHHQDLIPDFATLSLFYDTVSQIPMRTRSGPREDSVSLAPFREYSSPCAIKSGFTYSMEPTNSGRSTSANVDLPDPLGPATTWQTG